MSVDTDSADQLAERVAAADRGERVGPAHGEPAAVPAVADDFAPYRDAVIRYGASARQLLAPEVAKHWTDANIAALGDELAATAKHYDWKWGAVLTHPLARLGAAAWPLAMPIVWPYVEPFFIKLLMQLMGKRAPATIEGERAAEQPAAPPASTVSAPPVNAAGVAIEEIRLSTPPAPNRVAPLEGTAPVS